MSQDPRYTAVQNCSSTALTLLAGGTVVLTSFGLKLLAAGFLDQAALNSILDTPSHNHDKAYKLLQCVIAQVKTSPELFYEKYLQVLEQCPPLCALLDSIRQEYGMLCVMALYQCSFGVNQSLNKDLISIQTVFRVSPLLTKAIQQKLQVS